MKNNYSKVLWFGANQILHLSHFSFNFDYLVLRAPFVCSYVFSSKLSVYPATLLVVYRFLVEVLWAILFVLWVENKVIRILKGAWKLSVYPATISVI